MATNNFVLLISIASIALGEPTWQTLRVRWNINPFSSNAFVKLPLKENEANGDGFEKIKGSCSGGKFLGHRYSRKGDPAVVLIYDSKGYIAGIQSGIPKNIADNLNTDYSFSSTPAFLLHDDTYYRTSYFVKPSTICHSKRTSSEFEENIGSGLWIQNGENPVQDSTEVPLYESNVKDTKWTKGKCFVSMGTHYWYNIRKDMDCKEFFPYFLMYNRGKLTGFGFASVGKFNFSDRFEYPPKKSFSKFLDPVPSCLEREYDKSGGFTTMHIYFTVRPWNLLC